MPVKNLFHFSVLTLSRLKIEHSLWVPLFFAGIYALYAHASNRIKRNFGWFFFFNQHITNLKVSLVSCTVLGPAENEKRNTDGVPHTESL